MTRRIAIYAQNFNPPNRDHIRAARRLSDYRDPNDAERFFFDEIIIVPSGARPDKSSIDQVTSLDRATMVDLAFRGIPRCRVDLFDLEHEVYTPNVDFETRYGALGEVWQVVSEYYVRRDYSGSSKMEAEWNRGEELWAKGLFVVLVQEEPVSSTPFPPLSLFLKVPCEVPRSAEVRKAIFSDEEWFDRRWLSPRVTDYIYLRKLYQGPNLCNPYRLALNRHRPLLVTDDDGEYRNPKTVELRRELGLTSDELLTESNPTCIIVLGGDGTMMRAIRKYWRLRVPFIGINAGHRGFHLNQPPSDDPCSLLEQEMDIYQFPMLTVRWKDPQGEWHESIAYQDAWIQQAYSTVWIAMYENDHCRYERLVADAALVALPVGSTGYARAMGAQICPVTVPQLTFAVACFNDHSSPNTYAPRTMRFDSKIRFENLQPGRRTPMAIADGVQLGPADEMEIRVSRVVSALIAYPASHDFSARLR